MDKGNCVVKFELIIKFLCEFLAHSNDLIICFVKYHVGALEFSLHYFLTKYYHRDH